MIIRREIYICIWKVLVFLNENLKKIIYESLLKIDSNTFYGLAPQKFIREANKLDYIVYGSAGFSKAGTSGKDLVDYFSVSVIREDFVPEEIKQTAVSVWSLDRKVVLSIFNSWERRYHGRQRLV